MSDELKIMEQELEKSHETIKDDKVAHFIELREMEKVTELELQDTKNTDAALKEFS